MRRFVLIVLVLSAFCLLDLASAQTLKVLYNFGTNSGDPIKPLYPGFIAQGRDGSLYSTTLEGGAIGNNGTVFRISPAGKLTVLHSFGDSDGSSPLGGLTLGSDGNFYGTTLASVFKINSSRTLTTFTFLEQDSLVGFLPYGAPIQGRDGNFYGTTSAGSSVGGGAVYKITPSGTITRLHGFLVADGYTPFAPLVLGTDGNFYGTTTLGGTGQVGTIFRISATGTYRVLYNFDTTHGLNPYAALVEGVDGNFYGTTVDGGAFGLGVIFQVTPKGAYTVLHDFAGGASDGANPTAGLTLATDGNFYGVAEVGGTSNVGVLFKMTPQGTVSVLYNFDNVHGAFPAGQMIQHTNGRLCGAADEGGTANEGTFFCMNLGLGPFVSLVTPAAKIGKSIGILGQGLTGTTSVSFGGVAAASFAVQSDTYMTATVPTGATTGTVTVVTPTQTLRSNVAFEVVN